MGRKRIVLIQPDSPFLTVPLSFPGLGLLYISSYLKQNGFNPSIYDLTGGKKLPEGLQADVFGFSSQITQFRAAVAMKDDLRKENPNSIFVIGGPFPTHSPEESLKSGFDVIVRGEGEIPMYKIVKNFPNISKGIYSSNKKEFTNPNQTYPDWEGIDPIRYTYQLEGKRVINIMTKRGNCPYVCTFCAKSEYEKSPLRLRSIENVLKEVKHLKKAYGFGAIAIYDDEVFVGEKERDKTIFRGLSELDMPYRCMTRTNLVTREDIKFLKDTGCSEVCVGIETGDHNILENIIRKGTTVEQNTLFIQNCRDIGLRVKAYLIIGLPSESEESVNKTRSWLKEAHPNNFDLSIFTPYPGSDIYKNRNNYEISWDENYLRELWFSGKAQYEGCAVSTPSLSSDRILDLKKEIEEEFSRGQGGLTEYWGPIAKK